MRTLVTGAAGYIASHACKRLLDAGHTVVGVDNLSRGHLAPMRLLAERGPLTFAEADLNDTDTLLRLIDDNGIELVMHFAALAQVGESVHHPLLYHRGNIAGGVSLLEACDRAHGGEGIKGFVFSSSCAVYGDPPAEFVPLREQCPKNPISPYGRSKLIFEQMLIEYAEARRLANRPFAAAMMRYFNVAGADREGLLGEDHRPETHLIPIAINAALGRRDGMSIFGTDYATADGTCVRDYVHVEDLIAAHVAAIENLDPTSFAVRPFNVGIGRGYSVREIIDSVKRVTGVDFAVREEPRRPGDPPELFNDPAHIKGVLGWQPEITDLDEIVATAHDWLARHPDGYGDG